MKEKTCLFTGHRTVNFTHRTRILKSLKVEIEKLILEGYDTFVAGGALGFDTLAEITVLGLKRKYPHIKLHMVLPCENQDIKWSEKDRETYREILEEADSVETVSRVYTPTCMRERNYKMVDMSSVCITYFDGRVRSGTQVTVTYAKKSGLKVINLY